MGVTRRWFTLSIAILLSILTPLEGFSLFGGETHGSERQLPAWCILEDSSVIHECDIAITPVTPGRGATITLRVRHLSPNRLVNVSAELFLEEHVCSDVEPTNGGSWLVPRRVSIDTGLEQNFSLTCAPGEPFVATIERYGVATRDLYRDAHLVGKIRVGYEQLGGENQGINVIWGILNLPLTYELW